jgi:hypothetical protein
MDMLKGWVEETPLFSLALTVILSVVLAAMAGAFARRRDLGLPGRDRESGEQEGYIVSGVLGLLALLMGFTFALAVDRFESRRILVLEEANALDIAYLQTQLLEEPHRARLSALLIAYTDNRLALARANRTEAGAQALMEKNDLLIVQLWTATASAFQAIKGLEFSTTYVDSISRIVELDASRKAARSAHVPAEVFILLVIYLAVTAAVLGYVLIGPRGRSAAGFMLALMTLSLLLILDIDSPNRGGVRENQRPMTRVQAFMKSQPASVYDYWRRRDFPEGVTPMKPSAGARPE